MLDDVDEVEVATPHGACSDTIILGSSRATAWRIDPNWPATHPPHRINARANVWALHSLGVRTILAPTPSGSLRPAIGVGSIVVPDQLVDRTGRTDDTFHDNEDVHLSFADPFPQRERRAVVDTLQRNGWVVNDGGTLVAIRGPRYSTRAESRWYAAQGWDLISQTPYPEAALAAELGIGYVCVALVTDHDVIAEIPWPVTQEVVTEALDRHTQRLRQALLQVATELDVAPARRAESTAF